MSDFVFFNGEIIRADAAKVSALDRGLLYGDGLFETMRAYAGKLFRFADHIERMKNSARVLKIPFDIDAENLHEAALQLIKKNGFADVNFRITLTRGELAGGLDFQANAKPTLLMTARNLNAPTAEDYKNGVLAIVVTNRGISPLAAHKTISYLPYLVARDEAVSAGAREALICAPDGNVLEGATSNFFIVKNGKATTPPADGKILPGIARRVVLEILKNAGEDCAIEAVTINDLQSADEIFLTNSIVEVLSATIMRDKPASCSFGSEILKAYRKKVTEEIG